VLKAYDEVTTLLQKASHTATDKIRIRDLLVTLEIYTVDKKTKAVRRNKTIDPQWAWLRKNRGTFDREPGDKRQNVEFVAEGRGDWIGWVELAKEPVDETATRMTARVIHDIRAHVLELVEVEDLRFNRDLIDCYSLPGFDIGNRPGTFDSCVLRNRFDYIFISKSLRPFYTGGRVFRKGLWGSRDKRLTLWDTYPEITASKEGASDHSAVVIELNL